MIADLPDKTYNLIPTSEVIAKAKAKGVYFGFGKEENRIRYLIKVGLLPHQIRKHEGRKVISYLPDISVDKLLEIQTLQDKKGMKIPKIVEYFEAKVIEDANKSKELEALEITKAHIKRQSAKLRTAKSKIKPQFQEFTAAIAVTPAQANILKRAGYMSLTALLILPILFISGKSLINSEGARNKVLGISDNLNQRKERKIARKLLEEQLSKSEGDVLAAQDINLDPVLEINVPINALGQTISLGTGSITASNIVYEVVAGEGITITGDPQRPTISTVEGAGGVTSFNGLEGAITLTAGSGVAIDGTEISVDAGSLYSWQTKINGATGDTIENGDALNFISGADIVVSKTGTKEISFALNPIINTVTDLLIPTGGNIGIGGTLLSDSADGKSGAQLLGVYTTGFTNISPATNDLQTVLEAIEANLGGGSKWTINGGTLHPTQYATKSLGLGGVDNSAPIFLDIDTPAIVFSTDTNLYRAGANILRTDDALTVGGNLSVGTTSSNATLDVRGGISIGSLGETNDILNVSPAPTTPTNSLYWGNYEVCTLEGNCTGVDGGGMGGSGTAGYLAKFTGSFTIEESILYETTSSLNVTPTSGGTEAEFRLLESTLGGSNYTGFKAPATLDSNYMYTLPSSAGTADYVLTWQSGNLLEWKQVTDVGSAGDITSVTAGSGLTGGGTEGAVTLNIGQGNGITVGASNITLKLPSTQNLKNTVSYSGLEVDGDGLSLLAGCSASNFLVWNGSNWTCGDIDAASGISNIGNVTSGSAFTATGSEGTSLYFYDPDGRGQLTVANLTAPRTYTLPNASGTFALLGATQSFTGTNTFTQNTKLNRDNYSLIFDAGTALETDFWIGLVNDGIGDNNDYFRIGTGNTAGTSEVFTVAYDGNVGIGSATPGIELDVVGNARFSAVGSGAYANDLNLTADGTLTTNSSDRRLKENIDPLSSTLDKVLSLNTYTFNWKEDPTRTDIGLIAQETAEIFPEIVFTNQTDGYMGINYSRLPTILVKAIQEQQGLITSNTESIIQYSSLPDYLLNTLGMQDSKINLVRKAIDEKANQKMAADNREKISSLEDRLDLLEETLQLDISILNTADQDAPALSNNSWSWDSQNNALTSDQNIIAYKDMRILGIATANQINITNKATVGLIVIDSENNSINALASKLYIQSSTNAGPVDMFNGLITMSPNGEIIANKVTAEIFTVNNYRANGKENTSATAGRSTIKAGFTEAEIETTHIKEESIVIITPESLIDFPLAVTEKFKGDKFKIEIPKGLDKDIEFSWMIVDVNVEDKAPVITEKLPTEEIIE